MANLSWTASTETSWIHISPTAGTGSQNVTIRTDKAGYGETDLTGEVKFTGSDGSERVVQVTRCKETECQVDYVEYTYPNNASGTAEPCQTIVNVDIPFTATTHYSTPGCEDDTVSGFSAVTYTISKNETDKPIHHVKRIGNTGNLIVIVQEGNNGPCDCGCGVLTLDNYLFTWGYDERSEKIANIIKNGDCATNLSLGLSGDTSKFNIEFSDDKTTVNITPIENNTSGENYHVRLNVKYKSGGRNCETGIVEIYQAYQDAPECPTYTIEPTSGNINGDCSGGTVTFTATIQ